VGYWCRPSGERFYRVVIPGRWQTGALAGDYRGRSVLQRRVRQEQQCNQHRTHHRKKSENWHWRRPFRTARSLRTLIKPGQRSWSSWIKDQAAWHERIILRQAMSDQNRPPVDSEN